MSNSTSFKLDGFVYKTLSTNVNVNFINQSVSKNLIGLGNENQEDSEGGEDMVMDCDENGEIDRNWSFTTTLNLDGENGFKFEIKLTIEPGEDDEVAQMEVFIGKSFDKNIAKLRLKYHFQSCYFSIVLLSAHEEAEIAEKEIYMVEQQDITKKPSFFDVWINCERAFKKESLIKSCRTEKETKEDGSIESREVVSAKVHAVLNFGFPELIDYIRETLNCQQDLPSTSNETTPTCEITKNTDTEISEEQLMCEESSSNSVLSSDYCDDVDSTAETEISETETFAYEPNNASCDQYYGRTTENVDVYLKNLEEESAQKYLKDPMS